jgi:uncharacterized protein (TIGR02246 family)
MADAERDEREIRNLVARYCHAIVEQDDAAWADTWAEDAAWLVLGAEVHGRAAILEHYRKLVARMRWVVQVAHDGLVEVAGDAATGRWLILEFLQTQDGRGGQNVARYRDRYVRCADGRWRFARRELTATYFGPADLSGGPLPAKAR